MVGLSLAILLQWYDFGCTYCLCLDDSWLVHSLDHLYSRTDLGYTRNCSRQLKQSWPNINQALSLKTVTGGINGGVISETTLKSLDYRRDYLFLLSLFLHNTKPVARQVFCWHHLHHSHDILICVAFNDLILILFFRKRCSC